MGNCGYFSKLIFRHRGFLRIRDQGINPQIGNFGKDAPIADPEAQHKQTIMWNCDNVSTIDDNGRNSPTYTIRGMKWSVIVSILL